MEMKLSMMYMLLKVYKYVYCLYKQTGRGRRRAAWLAMIPEMFVKNANYSIGGPFHSTYAPDISLSLFNNV